jgi:hypothetical protein
MSLDDQVRDLADWITDLGFVHFAACPRLMRTR